MTTGLITSLVSAGIGAALAAVSIVVGVSALTPTAQQSDAPLIVYGQE